ncbi:hypothetical protein N499_0179B, partial [Wolbachia pipientis wVitA]
LYDKGAGGVCQASF